MSLSERMKSSQSKAGMTVSDMAYWFGVTRASMHTWLHEGREPNKAKHWQLTWLLDLLEMVTESDLGIFPVPLDVRQYDRREYIEKVKNHAAKSVSENRTSRAGV